MAQHKSAITRTRRNERRRIVNKNRVSRIRTFLRKVEDAITSGNKKEANEAFQSAQPELQRGVSKGVFHKNTVARKLSRLQKRIKTLG
jgi:small subunit ribosomal protein S20